MGKNIEKNTLIAERSIELVVHMVPVLGVKEIDSINTPNKT